MRMVRSMRHPMTPGYIEFGKEKAAMNSYSDMSKGDLISLLRKRDAPDVQGEPESSGLYAVYLRDNWDGEGDTYWILARKQDNGVWVSEDSGKELIEHEGDALLKVVPLVAAPQLAEQQPAPDVSALVGALETVMYCRQVELLPLSVQRAASDALAAHRKGGE